MRICLISSSLEILGGFAVQARQLVDGLDSKPIGAGHSPSSAT
jgi:hypothetical protein